MKKKKTLHGYFKKKYGGWNLLCVTFSEQRILEALRVPAVTLNNEFSGLPVIHSDDVQGGYMGGPPSDRKGMQTYGPHQWTAGSASVGGCKNDLIYERM